MRLYLPAVALSAWLLFVLEPLISKHLLPQFGGAAAVWTTALVYFQVLLLAGYAWAHWLARLSPRRQVWLQGVLALAALLQLAWQSTSWPAPLLVPPAAESPWAPVLGVLQRLAAATAVPFLLLATTSPLLQAWLARTRPRLSPYPLYAVSNTGSLLALLAFPFLLEPLLPLDSMAWCWSAGLVLLVLLLAGPAVSLWRSRAVEVEQDQVGPGPRPGTRQLLAWLSLAALGSALLLAVTARLTQEVAPVPFLWVLTLGLYLFSFMLVFSPGFRFRRSPWALLVLGLLVLAALAMLQAIETAVVAQVAIFCGLLLAGTVLVHGQLAARKPHPAWLTRYYLALSAGGALGGLAVALLAPLLFDGPFELHLCLLLLLLVVLVPQRGVPPSPLRRYRRLAAAAVALVVVALLAVDLGRWYSHCLLARRNFYGTLRVCRMNLDGQPARWLFHGITAHGAQLEPESLRGRATTYYTAASGAGLAINRHPRRRDGQPLVVATVGLGVGTVLAHARAGDRFIFYEIDPEVVRLARSEWFSFLRDSPAAVETRVGDGRLLLERELAAGRRHDLDVLIVDAFSSDSIPVHLLTREAFAIYRERLRPDGILAFHVSNRYLMPELEVAAQAAGQNLPALFVEGERDPYASDSLWVLLTANQRFIAERPDWVALRRPGGKLPVAVWSDDFSNLLEIVDWRLYGRGD